MKKPNWYLKRAVMARTKNETTQKKRENLKRREELKVLSTEAEIQIITGNPLLFDFYAQQLKQIPQHSIWGSSAQKTIKAVIDATKRFAKENGIEWVKK